ncbi:MAG TPA: class I SAM-dependent methyltransferase [Deltaproteobacteria bacterium]|nr:class I SAM-dependent methyltransferase [Deltaproteobacteria bacterium]HQI80436.1 class I SAM-dependent methyltransferase [Deltaproteobacteria bacterium]
MTTCSTRDFHRNSPVDLMKELTICESLGAGPTSYTRTLGMDGTYGGVLGGFLVEQGLLPEAAFVLEAGGGYGTLMLGLLKAHGHRIRKACMVDLSRRLLRRQQERLADFRDRVSFVQADIHDVMGSIRGCDLVIVNEVMGDLDVTKGLHARDLREEARSIIEGYGLAVPEHGEFTLNTGAIRLVESLCRSGVPAFLSEHSCDPIIPRGMPYLARGLSLDSFPREIRLHGHSEYTVRFSHLTAVARALGRETRTGSLLELLGIPEKPSWRFIFTAQAAATDDQAIVLEFLEHVREYRWLTIS